ncbi:MAG: PQQ-binding-like beta-propeller repeat protein [Gammaproteobacteria bacterium]|nr:PQQ-binding-like beta-propeller repeat protein [Gammaproteobacteria bacterium]
MKQPIATLLLWAAALQVPAGPTAPPVEGAPDAAALYAERCAACHDHPRDRIPPRISLAVYRTPEEIIDALTTGIMRQQAAGLSTREIRALAVGITGKEPAAAGPDPDANRCRATGSTAPPLSTQPGDWNGWGHDLANTRFHGSPGLTARDLPRLKLKWAFAYPSRAAFGQPTVLGDWLFTAGAGRRVYALDARTGCTHWSHATGSVVRTAVVVTRLPGEGGRVAAWFGDDKARVHAIDASTGDALWTVQVDEHPGARVLSTPAYHDGRIYLGVSSNEEVAAADPKYECCTFRGSVVALDARSGRILWKSYTVREAPQPTRINTAGTQMYGPAGGAVFSSPTIDVQRGLLYAGTGDGYTSEGSDSTDAVIALDLATGERRWTSQVRAHDSWILGCESATPGANCPSPLGEDYDFASSPILATLRNGRQRIVAGAKSGILYGFDPEERGHLIWQVPLVAGSSHGGILWGPAVDGKRAYVATSRYDYGTGRGPGGLSAVDLATGRLLWTHPAPVLDCAWSRDRCSQGQIAAVTAIPGAVFSGALDGRLRAYAGRTGKVLWQFDTAQDFPAVNGGTARGGGMDFGGQIIAHGMLFVHSGSTRTRGNALLAFSIDGK